MRLLFLTGNPNKLKEAKAILQGHDIACTDVDLPEIQEVNGAVVVEDKIRRALKLVDEPVFVEDTSLCFEALNGLPGALVKWFVKAIHRRGLVDIISAYNNKCAMAQCFIGYGYIQDGNPVIKVFEGSVKGQIVEPRGESGFCWDPIFQPDGYEKTFAEMNQEEKNKISHRRIALEKFAEYLKHKSS